MQIAQSYTKTIQRRPLLLPQPLLLLLILIFVRLRLRTERARGSIRTETGVKAAPSGVGEER